MKIERWYWLGICCVISLFIHVMVGMNSRTLGFHMAYTPPQEIEVALEPMEPEKAPEPEKKKPEPENKQPEPKKVAKAEIKQKPDPVNMGKKEPVKNASPKPVPEPKIQADEPRPTAPKVEPGGVDPKREEVPLPLGLPRGQKDLKPTRVARAEIAPDLADPQAPAPEPKVVVPEEQPELRTPQPPGFAPRLKGSRTALSIDPSSLSAGPADDRPELPAAKATPGPRLTRIVKNLPPDLSGGGSPAPGPVPGGKGGAPGPEAPPEDVLFNGGGAGGLKLPRVAPRIGGGGGRSIISVNNRLAREAIPEERPGLGPGTGGGEGAGAGGGVGFGRGKGIGTRLDGKVALGTLRAKPGQGIGAGAGDGIGTRSPGGGTGTGAELPGTGGSGLGYGRGKGLGVGNGTRLGVGRGNGGGGGTGGDGDGPGGGGSGGGGGRMALNRGIPFGDIVGLLTGDPKGGGGPGGGPGGPGRGALFGARPKGGGGAKDPPVHIVYVLDASTSMRRADMIYKAKEALKKALSELKPGDTFNIVHFGGDVQVYAASTISATPENVREALDYVDTIPLRAGTFMSAALERALYHHNITHAFLLSDGEPSRGVTNPDQLRTLVKETNKAGAQVHTLALGLGDQFPGIALLKGIAQDNEGKFSYINLAQ